MGSSVRKALEVMLFGKRAVWGCWQAVGIVGIWEISLDWDSSESVGGTAEEGKGVVHITWRLAMALSPNEAGEWVGTVTACICGII